GASGRHLDTTPRSWYLGQCLERVRHLLIETDMERCLSSLLEPGIRRLLIADHVEPAGLPGPGSARPSGAVSNCEWRRSTARDVAVSPRHRWHLAWPAPHHPGQHAAHPG